jgi:glycosyltransferase involved in cell wall biosynthesis
MRIAIVVHGRWDAFDISRELSSRGHDVSLFTNYPRWAVRRFGVACADVRSFWPHGVLMRAVGRLGPAAVRRFETPLHRLFGHWAAGALKVDAPDVLYIFSGIAEESLRALEGTSCFRLLVRESSHIRTQRRLLREEELRTRAPQDKPSAWMVAREEREYRLADAIRVVSSFAYQTFLDEGVPSSKLRLIKTGIDVRAFRAAEHEIASRHRRIATAQRLRVLNVGTFAFRKGVWDLATVINALGTERFEFRFVGPILAEARPLVAELKGKATFVSKQAQSNLPASYAWGDVFVLPTIEDGYAVVLAQAAAAGLPIITTPNGAGRDLVLEGETGWVVPIRTPSAVVERLDWAERHRVEVATIASRTATEGRVRDASVTAAELERVCLKYIGAPVFA